MNENRNCQWRIARRPEGNVVAEDFLYTEEEIPSLGDGEFLLKTYYVNLAPVMRMYMSGVAVAGERPLDIGDVIVLCGSISEYLRNESYAFAAAPTTMRRDRQ